MRLEFNFIFVVQIDNLKTDKLLVNYLFLGRVNSIDSP